jgi:hypothetical protein
MTYTLDRSNLTRAKTGDKVWVACFNTGRGVFGTVGYSGPSSTPGCWRVEVFPADARHPVRPIGRACAV